MDSTVDIRKRIHDFIDIADERILRIFKGIIDAEEEEDNYSVPDSHYDVINERREKYIKGESKSYTWEEVQEKAKSALK
ncbi:addiction module family protein [Chryseobacterium sp. PS-8]|uniref:Addiction module family protein n=2 Tax=Chryseobacterium TaxID=59732 RepID=A0A3D9AN37_9FLAO|nr:MULTISPECIES: addiction module family protein [Chryseobacterium]MCF2220139.1 addiction module family protein [Chryseobacterium sp. PS-8]REC42730.1 addiction module family protein [Candidatus Chryseobacterium massiliae]